MRLARGGILLGVASCFVTTFACGSGDDAAPAADSGSDGVSDAGSDADAHTPFAFGTLVGITPDDLVLVKSGKTVRLVPLADPSKATFLCSRDYVDDVETDSTGKVFGCYSSSTIPPGPHGGGGSTTSSFIIATASKSLDLGSIRFAGDFARSVSPDGERVAYYENRSVDCTNTAECVDLKVVNVDGTGWKTLESRVPLPKGGLDSSPTTQWARKVLLSVKRTDVATNAAFTITSLDAANDYASTMLSTKALDLAAKPSSSAVAILETDGSLSGVPLDGGAPILLDTNVSHVDMLPDGKTLIYGTMGGTLKRVSVDGSASAVLVASGFTDLGLVRSNRFGDLWSDGAAREVGLSPDGRTLFFTTQPAGTLALVSAVSASKPQLLPPLPDPSYVASGDLFTADSKFALYYQSRSRTTMAAPIAGGAPIMLEHSLGLPRAASGSRVVYSTTAAIRVVDLANPGAARDIVRDNDSNGPFVLTSARDRLVYQTASVIYNTYATPFRIEVVPIP